MASPDEIDDDKNLKEVAKMSRQNLEIEDLGEALGITVADIESAKVKNQNGATYEGSLALLRRWYRGQRASEWKRKLINALTQKERHDIVNKCFSHIDRVDEPMRPAQPQSSRPATGSPSGKWKDCHVKPVPQSYVPDQDLHYKMWTSLKKGNALIIGNDFIRSENNSRPYADKDIHNMTLLLKRLGYDFQNDAFIKRNLTQQEMNATVNKFVEYLRDSNPQSAVVYISSHGNKDVVYGNDNVPLAIPDLLQQFNGILPGKPKVIIIDACWGADETHGTPVSSSNSGSQVIMMPHNADIFLIHATSYGKVSWSFTEHGSWLVDKLCEVVYAKDRDLEDLDTIMLRVTRKLRALEATDEYQNKRGTQSPTVIKQGVDKKLFFYPGYKQ